MIFFIQGNIDFKKVIRTIEKVTADIPFSITERQRTEPFLYIPKALTLNKETHQAHVMIGSRGYNAYDDKRTALYLLNNVLGGPGMNSVLNVSLREKRGYVYTVESSVTSYTDTGLFTVYFGTDHRHTQRCIDLVKRELKRVREQRLSPAKLAAAKRQFMGQIEVSTDHSENVALALGKSFLRYGRFDSLEEIASLMERITADDILEVANELLSEDRLSMLIYE